MKVLKRIKIIPVAAPRMTRADRYLKRPEVLRYFDFKDELYWLVGKSIKLIGNPLSLLFEIPMPKSWSKEKRALHNGQPHKSKPDLDNLIKAFQDALLEDDSHIYEYGSMKKIWSTEGAISILAHDNQ